MGWGLHVKNIIIALSPVPSPNPVHILLPVCHTVLKVICTWVGFESGSKTDLSMGLRLI